MTDNFQPPNDATTEKMNPSPKPRILCLCRCPIEDHPLRERRHIIPAQGYDGQPSTIITHESREGCAKLGPDGRRHCYGFVGETDEIDA